MISKTRGIVFRYAKLRETSIIVTILTEVYGLQSYVVNGVRGSTKSSGSRMALYQPLTLLDLVVYHREHANLNRIREVRCLHQYRSLTTDIRKTTIMMFLDEILNKTIKEESQAGDVFEFIHDSLIAFDKQSAGVENFHLMFMIQLMKYVGFGAQGVEELDHLGLLAGASREKLAAMITCSYLDCPPLEKDHRRDILDCLVRFYKEHIDPLGEIRSIQVLRETLG